MNSLASIPGGAVQLRDARRGTERTVTPLPFHAGIAPVTVTELAAGHLGAASANGGDLPATGVRWFDAVTWCNTASEHDGREPAYRVDGGAVRWKPAADGYRLPTEAEWVHASLGGDTGARHGLLADIAWAAADGVSGPQPVGRKAANSYGLVDTLGNVWEWCWDRLDPARYADYRLLKGGGWADPVWSCRVGVRRGNAPNAIIEDVGFRVVTGAVMADHTADGGQGWSEREDRARASISPPLPAGWTPLQFD
ncbi:formylglycine-generating enzyme family protein [Nesterenkonia xinjiangensis]|uniref:formylglycine-generating enzyme family protein n=1 Tax=Nesterenkonia xinjiangensis TaxID=225327 RepID=UPI0015C91FC1|nr:SUMF1/EgtB/PvdO family nonheme iron enzyme [Nesterenkonia xinjiangensis]